MTDITPIQKIIAEIRAGRMVVLVDEEDRENEGDLVFAAEFVTPELVNFMARHGRGLICLTLTEAHCKQLNLPLMVRDNGSPLGTNFTLSIEAASGVNPDDNSLNVDPVGYSMTGDTGEQVLFIPYGSGANGKSTFVETD